MVKFREHVLSTGKKIIGGRSAENNDELVKNSKRSETLLHTKEPGSPFVNVGESPTKKEIKEAAIFCAGHSQTWRDGKTDVLVNVFKKSDMEKGIFMKKGSWKVKKSDTIKIRKSEVEGFEKK